MPDLPFPASGGVLDAFLERMRFSPRACVDVDWFMRCLGVSKRPNARRTLKWLQKGGILGDDGYVTPRGETLLAPTDPDYTAAAQDVLSDLVGPELLVRLKNGQLSRSGLEQELRSTHKVGKSAASKAIVGIFSVAQLAQEGNVAQELIGGEFQRHEPTYPTFDFDVEKSALLARFDLFTGGTGGIDRWLRTNTPDETFDRLLNVQFQPLTAAQLNELLTLAHAPPLTLGFFRYYWLSKPNHPYDLVAVPNYNRAWEDSQAIFDLDQLYWGLYRFYIDALLFFGNVRSAYQVLRTLSFEELERHFRQHMFDTEALIARGSSLPLSEIKRDDRYLIAEQACKSYAPDDDGTSLKTALVEAYREHASRNPDCVTAAELLGVQSGSCDECGGPVNELGRRLMSDKTKYILRVHAEKQGMFAFSANEILTERICSEDELLRVLEPIMNRFGPARAAALRNTDFYLAAVGDLDVYVATSMRSRQNFHEMAEFCDNIFDHRTLRKYHLRYFDPTMSAAKNHEDKGLIECLMVKCAKLLIYTAGDRDSYGKDAEAAMALSLGKPVIFYCHSNERQQFFEDVHPLSRLVNFANGVAVGAIVTDSEAEVVTIIDRLLSNAMRYELEQKRPGYLVLREQITKSGVRLQTSDDLLRETFWNHYHGNRPDNGPVESEMFASHSYTTTAP
jgi:hypothetical protein